VLAAAEGMLLKKAVVATDGGGLRDLIEPDISGILVPPGNPLLLAQALRKIITDPQLRGQLGVAAREPRDLVVYTRGCGAQVERFLFIAANQLGYRGEDLVCAALPDACTSIRDQASTSTQSQSG